MTFFVYMQINSCGNLAAHFWSPSAVYLWQTKCMKIVDLSFCGSLAAAFMLIS